MAIDAPVQKATGFAPAAVIGNRDAGPSGAAQGRLGSYKASFQQGVGGMGAEVDTGPSMKDYVDARDDAVESRVLAKLDKIPSTGQLWAAVAAIVGGAFTAVGIGLAALSFASDRFNGGLSVSPMIAEAKTQQAKIDAAQDVKASSMDAKLDRILKQTAPK